jgi:hypothetical protein
MLFGIVVWLMIIFVLYVGYLFYPIFLELLINIPALYLIYLLSYKDLSEQKINAYSAGLFAGAIILILFHSVLGLFWLFTWWMILSFFSAKVAVKMGVDKIKPNPLPKKRTGLEKVYAKRK